MRRNPEFEVFEQDWGITFDGAVDWLPDHFRKNLKVAMDAQPSLVTTPSGGIPSFLTTLIDPNIIKILLAPSKAAEIFGEVKKGSWVDQTAMFPVVERTVEVSSYGDRNKNGRSGLNMIFPQRQAYLYQVFLDYGELEMERAGLAKIGWAAELKEAATVGLNKFQNLTYFFGVAGLQNYGLLNDPSLTATLTPGTKANGNGNVWVYNGQINATANEVYADIQALFIQLVAQTQGLIAADDELILAMSPTTAVALTATNSFAVNVFDLLKKNFPKMRFEDAVQYGKTSSSNPQGIAAGNLVQLICPRIEGQDTGYCSFNEKLRSHPIIRLPSSFRQKLTQGTWGSIVRMPVAISQMLGV